MALETGVMMLNIQFCITGIYSILKYTHREQLFYMLYYDILLLFSKGRIGKYKTNLFERECIF